MGSCLCRFVVAVLAIAVGSGSLHASVIVVDPGGGPGATLLQSALDAAQPSDILLLKDGDYTGPLIVSQGKGVAIFAEAGAEVLLSGLNLGGAPASATTVVRGLHVLSLPNEFFPFRIASQGRAWIEECRSLSEGVPSLPVGQPSPGGLGAEGVAACVVVRCTLKGADGADAGTLPNGVMALARAGGHGLEAYSSVAAIVMETTASGGDGGNGAVTLLFPVLGGEGLLLGSGYSGFVLGGAFTGGDEGADSGPGTLPGSGLFATLIKYLFLRSATFNAGDVIGEGTPALPVKLNVFSSTEFEAPVRSLQVASPVRELQPAIVTVKGVRGDLAFAFLSATIAPIVVPGMQGLFLPGYGADVVPVPLGAITDASGVLERQIPMPRLPAGVDGMVLFAQVGVVAPDGAALLGSASAFAWLSATL